MDTAVSATASEFAEVLAQLRQWQLRKVESRILMEGRYGLTRVSVDCIPQNPGSLRYELSPSTGTGRSGSLVMVPVTFMRKGALRSFDMVSPSGETLSVIGRSEYRSLLVDVLLYELRGATIGSDRPTLVKGLDRLVDGDVNEALTIADALVGSGKIGEVLVLDLAKLLKPQGELLIRLAESYVLIALVPDDYVDRRVVLKYSHSAVQEPELRLGQRLLGALGIQPLEVLFELSHPAGSASHHLEVHVPPEFECSRLTMPDAPETSSDRNTQDLGASGVAHAVASYTSDPVGGAIAEFWVPWRGLRATAFWVAMTTFAMVGLGLSLPGALPELQRASDGAAAFLLAVPAVVVAMIAGARENALVSALLGPLRALILICGFILLACAASLVGTLHQPYMALLWVSGTLFSGALVFTLLVSPWARSRRMSLASATITRSVDSEGGPSEHRQGEVGIR